MQPAPEEPSPFKPVKINNDLLKKTILSNWILLLVPIISLCLAPAAINISAWWFILCVMGAICSGLFVYIKINSNQEKFMHKFRETVVMSLIRSKDSSINYEPKSFFSVKELNYSGLLELIPNSYYGENYFEQKKLNYTVELAWAHAHKQTTRYGNFGPRFTPRQSTTAEYLLDGLFYKFTLPKRFKTNIIIRQDKKRGLFKIFEENPDYLYNNFVQLPFNDDDFEKEFEVYAQNDTEAVKLVDEEFRKMLLELKKHYKKKLQLSMIDNAIYVTINVGKRYFKPGFILSKRSTTLQDAVIDAREIFYLPEQLEPIILKLVEQNK